MGSLGQRVKEIRESAGLGQAEFAKKIGVVASKISKVESGEQELQSEQLASLASRFGIDLHWLITGDGRMSIIRESGVAYRASDEVQRLAADLQRHPLLLATVRKALEADDRLPRLAKELASTLGISEEDAYLKLLEMKKETT